MGYKGSPSAGTKPHLVEVEDTEDNNGERGTYMLQTKSDLSVGGSIHNGNGADYSYMPMETCDRRFNKCRSKCRKKCKPRCTSKVRIGRKGRKKCQKCRSKIQSKCEQNVRENISTVCPIFEEWC